MRPAEPSEPRQEPITFPLHQSWGEVRRWEYPNPHAVYTTAGYLRTLAPGERYAPALLYQRAEYHVPFDSAGSYVIRVCADLKAVRLCGQPNLQVLVE
jgi:hypothetical protein